MRFWRIAVLSGEHLIAATGRIFLIYKHLRALLRPQLDEKRCGSAQLSKHILRHAGFSDINCDDKYNLGAVEIGIRIRTKFDDLELDSVSFVEKNRLGFGNVVDLVDLSAFLLLAQGLLTAGYQPLVRR